MTAIGDSMYRVIVIVMLWTIYLAASGDGAIKAIDMAMFALMVIGCIAGAFSGRD